MKMFVKKLKVLVAFLSNQKIGGRLGFLPLSFFLKIFWLKLWESHLPPPPEKNANFVLITYVRRAKIKICIN